MLQESGATYVFVQEVLPHLDKEQLNLNVYYVSSCELVDRLSVKEQETLLPQAHRQEAMAVTSFTLPTMFRWVTIEAGRLHSLHAFGCGHYPGSGQAGQVLREAGLDGESQRKAIVQYVEERQRPTP